MKSDERENPMNRRGDYSNTNENDRPNEDRGWWDRAGDEVLSWMGDDYATRRRRHDGPHRGIGPKNYVRSDDRIREDVNDRLTDEWNVDASDIEVSVANGEVTLTGFVADRFQKRRAEDVAEHVSGVRHVENRIKVEPETPKDNVNLIP
jgi:osmotically-inducible protein OsmY